MVITNSESPIVVVLRFYSQFNCSGSMEPAFQRGDLLFLTNEAAEFSVGEIVVFRLNEREIPIVHRILRLHQQ